MRKRTEAEKQADIVEKAKPKRAYKNNILQDNGGKRSKIGNNRIMLL